ncbi:hypothetical protein ACMD2_04882 [Ananas comosus]|uniref:EF-hand domain-containing protein n=1 Tax=Ananas comosus TaxID=4615 RepID=A0A199UMW5_ANACO|nr:hypothetical protein ACMD2_04882 [Ananas comosus]
MSADTTRTVYFGKWPITEEEFREWLQQLDRNKDGRISKEELAAGLQTLGLRCKRWRAWWAMKKNDADNSGYIDTESEIQKLVEHARKHWGIDIRSK